MTSLVASCFSAQPEDVRHYINSECFLQMLEREKDMAWEIMESFPKNSPKNDIYYVNCGIHFVCTKLWSEVLMITEQGKNSNHILEMP